VAALRVGEERHWGHPGRPVCSLKFHNFSIEEFQ
jgi:hypothetical protein